MPAAQTDSAQAKRRRQNWSAILADLGACREAREWAETQPSATAAWRTCERADWMLWLAGRIAWVPESASRKRLVLCACECARTALRHIQAGEERPLRAIETAEHWARGDGETIDEVRAAAYAAYDAYAAAYDAAATAAAYAAYDAYAAAYAAYDAYAAADAAADAADAAADARVQALREMALIVRRHDPRPPLAELRAAVATRGAA